jgi:hypothetical protein
MLHPSAIRFTIADELQPFQIPLVRVKGYLDELIVSSPMGAAVSIGNCCFHAKMAA